jgi:hypothetical protein
MERERIAQQWYEGTPGSSCPPSGVFAGPFRTATLAQLRHRVATAIHKTKAGQHKENRRRNLS